MPKREHRSSTENQKETLQTRKERQKRQPAWLGLARNWELFPVWERISEGPIKVHFPTRELYNPGHERTP